MLMQMIDHPNIRFNPSYLYSIDIFLVIHYIYICLYIVIKKTADFSIVFGTSFISFAQRATSSGEFNSTRRNSSTPGSRNAVRRRNHMDAFGVPWLRNFGHLHNVCHDQVGWYTKPTNTWNTMGCITNLIWNWWFRVTHTATYGNWNGENMRIETIGAFGGLQFSSVFEFGTYPSWTMWVCLKMVYTPNYSHLVGIVIINHWV